MKNCCKNFFLSKSNCRKRCSSCQYVNVSPCLCVRLHEKFQRNDRDDVVIAIGQFDVIFRSFPHIVESVAGICRMNWVLGPSPTVKNGVRSVEFKVILKQTHPRKWEMANNGFFALKGKRWTQSPTITIILSEIDRNVSPTRNPPKRPHKSLKIGWN